jgi:hypothetical protein
MAPEVAPAVGARAVPEAPVGSVSASALAAMVSAHLPPPA